MARRKYNNRKVMVDGYKFDSMKEAERYKELKLLERAGRIKDLELQPKFELLPTIRTDKETLRKVSYYADFKYEQDGETVVEDVKGFKTDVYKLKKRIFLLKYGKEYRFFENYM